MKFAITPNPFNSEILGKKSGRLVFQDRITARAVTQYLLKARREGYRFLDVLLREEERATAAALVRGGFDMVGMLVELARPLDRGTLENPQVLCRLCRPEDRSAITATGVAFVDDRYSEDPHIPRRIVDRFFKKWIENSIDGRADFIYVHKGAFCACFIRDGVGVIDLIGVPKSLQGRGVGVSLVWACLREFKERGCVRTIVKTAGTNVAAMRTYSICGYAPSILYYALHWHG